MTDMQQCIKQLDPPSFPNNFRIIAKTANGTSAYNIVIKIQYNAIPTAANTKCTIIIAIIETVWEYITFVS